MSTKRCRSCWSPKVSPNSKKSPMSNWPNSPASKASTMIWPRNSSPARLEALERQEEGHRQVRRELGVEDALAEIPHLTEAMLVTLGKAGIKTLDDLADLATDELIAKKREAPRRRNNDAAGPARCGVRSASRTRAACWANMA